MGVGFHVHDGELARHRRTTGSRMDPIRLQTDARLPKRRTPTEWLRAFPDSRNQTSHPPPRVIEHVDQEPVWTIPRDLNIDLLPRRIAMKKEPVTRPETLVACRVASKRP